MNGKGSKIRPYNKKVYDDNFDEINWNSDLIICCECGQPRKKLDKEKFMVQVSEDEWKCIKCHSN